MLWMGDTVIDIDRLIVTVISTRGWMLDASNRLCWLAHCLLVAPCFRLLPCACLLAGQDWTELDWTTNRHTKKAEPGTRYCVSVLINGRLSCKKSVTRNSKQQTVSFGAPFRSERVRNEKNPLFQINPCRNNGRWMNEWINQSINGRMDEKTNWLGTGKHKEHQKKARGKQERKKPHRASKQAVEETTSKETTIQIYWQSEKDRR